MTTKPLILGSGSPRRKEILSYFELPFTQVASSFDEESIPFEGEPERYVKELSLGKAHAIAARFPDSLILTADTVVFREGKIYGKPKDEKEAFASLSELVGHWHSVFTGVSLISGKEVFQGVEETKVLFNGLNTAQINHYHQRIHWQDKAGGYAIQMAGGLLVKRIDGCYYNVMGLPINTVRKVLGEVGLELWDYL